MLQNRRFPALASRSGFEAAVSVSLSLSLAAARSSTAPCNSVSAGRSGMVVLKLLAAVSVCV